MELRNKFKVKKILKKTSAVFFKNLKVGDEFELTYPVNGRYERAPMVDIWMNDAHMHSNSVYSTGFEY